MSHMKLKKKQLIFIVIGVLILIGVGVGIFLYQKSNEDPTTLSLKEMQEKAVVEEERQVEYRERTDTKEKVLALYEETAEKMAPDEDCQHERWGIDSEWGQEQFEELGYEKDIKYVCQDCGKEVVLDLLAADVYRDIRDNGEENSEYLGRLEENQETDAEVIWETETSEETETTSE